MLVNNDTAKAMRIKRAKENLTKKQASKMLKVSELTYRRIERGEYKTQRAIFERLMNWLVQDYE